MVTDQVLTSTQRGSSCQESEVQTEHAAQFQNRSIDVKTVAKSVIKLEWLENCRTKHIFGLETEMHVCTWRCNCATLLIAHAHHSIIVKSCDFAAQALPPLILFECKGQQINVHSQGGEPGDKATFPPLCLLWLSSYNTTH